MSESIGVNAMNLKSNRGVTLVEVIVTIAILAIIVIPVSTIFSTAYSSFIAEADKITAQQSAREILYGKGINSYGVMGDLERSNATVGDVLIDNSAAAMAGRSISITYDNGEILQYSFRTDSDGELQLLYKNAAGNEENYFGNDKSSNNNPVIVKSFVVSKVNKLTDDIELDNYVLNISVTVWCGRSGDISLQSTYRFPDIE